MTAANNVPAAAPRDPTAAPVWAAHWRWLALLAALLLLFAAWAPWVVGSTLNIFYVYPRNLLGISAAQNAPIDPLAWAVLTSLGLLIAPWLWSRHFRALAAVAFALWVLLLTVFLGIAMANLIEVYAPGLLHGTMEGLGLSFGSVLALLALFAGWWAAIPLLRAALRQRTAQGWLPLGVGRSRTPPPSATPYGARARAGLISGGAGAITAAMIIWGIGFQWMPWAAYPCGASALGGACLGISSGQAMSAALAHLPSGAAIFDLLLVPNVVPLLLLVGGLLLLYAIWRLPTTAALCGWVAVWLALATGTVLLASVGVSSAIASAPTVGGQTPTPYLANIVAGLGLALGWIGFIPLLVGSLAARPQQSP